MSRIPLALTLPLFLMTALVCWQILSLADAKSFATLDTRTSAAPVADHFYQALNATLESGDLAPLRSMLHASFLDHSADAEEAATAADLEDNLLAMRSAYPNLRFRASTVLTHGSLITTGVSLTGDREGSIEGVLPVALALEPSGFEVLKIEQGRIIERWSNLPGPIVPVVLLRAEIDSVTPGISPRTPRIEQLTLDRHARLDIDPHASVLLFVESGEVSLRGDSAVTVDQPLRPIQEGQAVTLPANTPITLVNTGLSRSRVVLVIVPHFDRANEPVHAKPARPLPAGVTRDIGLNGPALSPDAGVKSITLRRIRIPSSSVIPHHVTEGAHLIFVEDGQMAFSVARTEPTPLADRGVVSGSTAEIVVGPGESITALPGDEVGFRPIGPSHTTILVLTYEHLAER